MMVGLDNQLDDQTGPVQEDYDEILSDFLDEEISRLNQPKTPRGDGKCRARADQGC